MLNLSVYVYGGGQYGDGPDLCFTLSVGYLKGTHTVSKKIEIRPGTKE